MNEAYETQNRRRNNRRFWRALGASLATATIVSLSVITVMNGFDRQRLVEANETLTSQNEELTDSVEQLTFDTAKLATENAALTLTVAEQKKVLEARDGFVAALAEAQTVMNQASGLVDTQGFRELLNAQQEVVGAEHKYAANVDAATQTVSSATSELQGLLDARLQELAPGGVAPGIGTQDLTPYDTARRALNDVGGSWVDLRTADTVCSSGAAMACSSSNGHITVANRVMGRGYDFMYKLMMHEYAHQIQFLSLEELYASPQYAALFGHFGAAAIEAAADCMAQARTSMDGVGYGMGCTDAQLEWGRKAWDGTW